jgi:transcriptional regulator with XRE-family HTH domain
MTSRKEYLLAATGARSARAIAAAAGLDASTVNRQLTGASALTIETVVAICRAYSLDMAETFVGVGFITPDEADHLGRAHGLAEYSDLELAREIVRRIEESEATPVLTEPLDVGGVVQDLPERQREFGLAARSRAKDRGLDEGGFHA